MRMTSPARLAAIVLAFAVLLAAGRYGPLHSYVQAVKGHEPAAANAFSGQEQQELLEWIRSEAPKRRIEPKDAVIDRVWKAIPGYDGREVDVEATYAKARALGAKPGSEDAFPWVYKAIKPRIGLQDLPASPVYRGNSDKPMVGFMINVAWGNEYLESILNTLRKEHVSATFFFDGSWLSKNAALAQEIVREGHEASNHAYTHPNMSQLSLARQRQEIEKTETLLRTKLDVRNRWFAPPSGDFNQQTVEAAAGYGLQTVLWTLDTVDWRNPPVSDVLNKVSARVQAGTLILMHPTKTTRDALEGMIRIVRSKGLVPGTVADTLSSERLDLPAK